MRVCVCTDYERYGASGNTRLTLESVIALITHTLALHVYRHAWRPEGPTDPLRISLYLPTLALSVAKLLLGSLGYQDSWKYLRWPPYVFRNNALSRRLLAWLL